MGEENKISATAEAVKGAIQAVPVYHDAIQPGAKQLGTALETMGKGINVLLVPLKALIWGYDQFEKLFLPLLEDKLRQVAKERLVPPKLTVAGPLVE